MDSFSFLLNIGDLGINVQSQDGAFIQRLREKYESFTCESSEHIAVDITIAFQELPSRDDILVIRSGDAYDIDGGEFKGRYDCSSRTINAVLRPEVSVFDSFLRVLCSIVLTQYESCLIHAAGLAKDGRAYLFAGPSSSGKTTTARRAGEFDVLNDELTLVRKIKGEFYLYSTPFVGEYDGFIRSVSAPLKNIFFLKKQLQKEFETIEKAECLVQLLENVFFFDSNLESNQKILNLCSSLASEFGGININVLSREYLWELVDEIQRQCCYT